MNHWNYDTTQLDADPNVVNTVRFSPYPDGRAPRADDVGGWDGNSAAAFRIMMMVDTARAERNGVDDAALVKWEEALVAEVLTWDDPELEVRTLWAARAAVFVFPMCGLCFAHHCGAPHFVFLCWRGLASCWWQANVFASRSMDDALSKSVGGDMGMVAFGIMGMLVYAYVVLTRRLDGVHSRIGLTSGATAAVMLGMIAGTGLLSAFGISLSSLNQILIYVLCGIGVDDAFIITSSVDRELFRARAKAEREGRQDPALPGSEKEFQELFARGMATAGSSIGFTSVTDLVAFFLGSLTRIPAVSWFCLFAGTSVMMVFLMQV